MCWCLKCWRYLTQRSNSHLAFVFPVILKEILYAQNLKMNTFLNTLYFTQFKQCIIENLNFHCCPINRCPEKKKKELFRSREQPSHLWQGQAVPWFSLQPSVTGCLYFPSLLLNKREFWGSHCIHRSQTKSQGTRRQHVLMEKITWIHVVQTTLKN